VVGAIKGSNTPLTLMPGFALADAFGKPTEAAETVLRDGAVLPLVQS
jgi:hypothetical protein